MTYNQNFYLKVEEHIKKLEDYVVVELGFIRELMMNIKVYNKDNRWRPKKYLKRKLKGGDQR